MIQYPGRKWVHLEARWGPARLTCILKTKFSDWLPKNFVAGRGEATATARGDLLHETRYLTTYFVDLETWSSIQFCLEARFLEAWSMQLCLEAGSLEAWSHGAYSNGIVVSFAKSLSK